MDPEHLDVFKVFININIIAYVILLLNLFCIFYLVSSRQTSRKFVVIYEKFYDFNSAACNYAIHLNISNCVAFLLVRISNDNDSL